MYGNYGTVSASISHRAAPFTEHRITSPSGQVRALVESQSGLRFELLLENREISRHVAAVIRYNNLPIAVLPSELGPTAQVAYLVRKRSMRAVTGRFFGEESTTVPFLFAMEPEPGNHDPNQRQRPSPSGKSGLITVAFHYVVGEHVPSVPKGDDQVSRLQAILEHVRRQIEEEQARPHRRTLRVYDVQSVARANRQLGFLEEIANVQLIFTSAVTFEIEPEPFVTLELEYDDARGFQARGIEPANHSDMGLSCPAPVQEAASQASSKTDRSGSPDSNRGDTIPVVVSVPLRRRRVVESDSSVESAPSKSRRVSRRKTGGRIPSEEEYLNNPPGV